MASIALGTFPFAGPFTAVSEEAAQRIIDHFVELGGRHFDTAPTYAFGAVENLLGDAVQRLGRERLVIATSCGYVRDAAGTFVVSGKYNDVIADCNESLSRLRTEYIDTYYSHIPDLSTPFAETMAAMRDLKQDGKIRAIGVSNVTLDQLRLYNASGDIAYVQNRASLLNRTLDAQFSRYCSENGIAIALYQVLERGILTDRGAAIAEFRDGDLRNRKPEFRPEVRATLSRWVRERLQPLATILGVDVGALAVTWALHQPAVEIVQVGATNPRQIDLVMEATKMSLEASALAEIEGAYRDLEEEVRAAHGMSIRGFMGLEAYDLYRGSATGRPSTS